MTTVASRPAAPRNGKFWILGAAVITSISGWVMYDAMMAPRWMRDFGLEMAAKATNDNVTTIPSQAVVPIITKYCEHWYGRGVDQINGNGDTPLIEAAKSGDEASAFIFAYWDKWTNTAAPLATTNTDEDANTQHNMSTPAAMTTVITMGCHQRI